MAALVAGAFWVTFQATQYAELGDYLIRIGLSWLFLTFLSFLAFSGVVSALSTFFLSDDLRLVMVAPVAARRVFLARFARTLAQAGWMVVVFLVPVLAGVGLAKCAPLSFVAVATLTVAPFVVIPVGLGAAVTLLLVNVFPARRARDILMLMGLVFAMSLVILLRVDPARAAAARRVDAGRHRLLRHAAVAGHAAPAVVLGRRDDLRRPAGRRRLAAPGGAVDHRRGGDRRRSAARSSAGTSPATASRRRRARPASPSGAGSTGAARRLPLSPVRRQLLVKDVKVFLRDVSQWSQLLLLLALVLVYLYNFRVLDLDRMPDMSGVIKNAYAFLNLGMAGFVMATVTVRFVFPAVSAEGAAFWIIRTAPISLRDFLWSKFWTGLVPVLMLTECLDGGRQRVPRHRPVPQAAHRGGRGRSWRSRSSGWPPVSARATRALPPTTRARWPARTAAWRSWCGRALRAGDDRAARLAVVGVPLRADAPAAADRRAAVDDGRRRSRTAAGDERGHLAARACAAASRRCSRWTARRPDTAAI